MQPLHVKELVNNKDLNIFEWTIPHTHTQTEEKKDNSSYWSEC